MRRSLLAPAVLLVAATAMALTGCGAGAGPAASSSADSPRGTASPAPSTAATSKADDFATGDVCAAIPLAAVSAATGRNYTATMGASADQNGTAVTGCSYHDGDVAAGTDQILLDIEVFHDADPRGVFAYEESSVSAEEMQSISGIGDSAQLDEDELDVAWGRTVVAIVDALRPGDMNPLSRDAFESLAKQAHNAP